ncbi:DUF1289 domain-containing protein [Uliginosibacterium sp. sgz301328]|uniref:DUF1289 domain-containing protein n=1 Tax=Uliginosibacterium sp. sgz301328 TaxID=3243764 RepID=UPI00359EBF97
MNDENFDEIALPVSPCVRLCCLDGESDVCTGCFRSIDEIRAWAGSGVTEREAILDNCSRRREAHYARYGLPPHLREA